MQKVGKIEKKYCKIKEDKGKNCMITLEDFQKVDLRVGTILTCKINQGARKPAYHLTVDFGEEIGIKHTSAQITQLYQPDELLGKQVLAVVNFPPIHVASCKSEVLLLGVDREDGIVLLSVDKAVPNGCKVY